MTQSPDPSAPVEAPAPTTDPAPPPDAPAAPAIPKVPPAAQAIVGAGIAVAVLALIGGFLGAWGLAWAGGLLIVAGLAAAGAASMTATPVALASVSVGPRDVALTGAMYALVMGALFVAEKLFDLDDLDDYGGIIGVIVTFMLAAAAATLYVAVTGRWFGTLVGPWTSAEGGGRPTLLVTAGTGLVLLGWLGNVTIGVWLAQTAAIVIALVVIGFVLARAAAGSDGVTGQIPAIATVVVLGLAALLSLGHLGAIMAEDLGIDDALPQVVVVVGVLVAIGGAVLLVLPLVSTRAAPAD